MRSALSILALLLAVGSLPAQAPSASLTVRRPDGTETVLSAAQLGTLPRVTGRAVVHDTAFAFEGADLREVLRAAGVSPVDSLRGPQLRRVVVFGGADGYRAVIALADLDPSIGGRRAVLVAREDGAVLPVARGPRRIIVEGDARPSRWVQQVVRLDVLDVP